MKNFYRNVIIGLLTITTIIISCNKNTPDIAPPSRSVELTITSINPNRGHPGTRITIIGTGFNPLPSKNSVYIKDQVAAVVSATETELVVIAPSMRQPGAIRITVDGKTVTGPDFIYENPTTFVSGLNNPHSAALDSDGNLFISNNEDGTITKVTPEGVKSSFAKVPFHPRGVVIDKLNNVFVAIFTNNTISKITPGGSVSTFSSNVSAYGMAIDNSDHIYTTSYDGGFIKKISAAGDVSSIHNGLDQPFAVAVDDDGDLYVTLNKTTNSSLVKITPGGVRTTLTTGLENPYSIAIDKSKNIYVADHVGGTVTRVTPSGIKTQIARGFSYPTGLAIGKNGIMYVVSAGSGTVSRIAL